MSYESNAERKYLILKSGTSKQTPFKIKPSRS